MKRTRDLWMALIILLLFWLTRTLAADLYPVFIDETVHIEYGEQMVALQSPIYIDIGRLFTIWWIIPFQPLAGSPVWVARVAIVLASLPGLAALLAVSRKIAGRWGLLLTGVFFIGSSYLTFFGRMALADPIALTPIGIAIWAAYRLRHRLNYRDAILTGAALFGAYGAKNASLYFIVIPFAAALTLKPAGRTWRQQVQWMGVALIVFTLLFGAFTAGEALTGQCPLCIQINYALTGAYRGEGSEITGSGLLALPARILDNLRSEIPIQAGYAGPVGLLILAGGALILLWRRHFFLPLVMAITGGAVIAQSVQNTRYYFAPVALLVTCAGIGLGLLLHKRPRTVQIAAGTLLVGWLAIQWGPFFYASVTDPLAIPLPEHDFREHAFSDASSFGFAEISSLLTPLEPEIVFGIASNCQGLRYTTWGELSVTCPKINPNGSEREALAQLMGDNRRDGVYVVLEDSPYVPATSPGELLDTFVRPGNGPALHIYDLAP
jgi:hypothetical protein